MLIGSIGRSFFLSGAVVGTLFAPVGPPVPDKPVVVAVPAGGAPPIIAAGPTGPTVPAVPVVPIGLAFAMLADPASPDSTGSASRG